MSNGINKVILIGNLGADPDIRYTQSSKQVASLSIATSESWIDKNNGQKQEKTEWHRVVFFDRLAEVVGQYLQKGSKIYVEGKLQTRKWQNQQGVDQYTTEIVGQNMQMLSSRQNQGQQQPPRANPSPYQNTPNAQEYGRGQQQQMTANSDPYQNAPNAKQHGVSQVPYQADSFQAFNDDIPF